MKKTTKIHAVIYSVLGILLVFCAAMWGSCRYKNRELANTVNSGYDRAFFELTDYVNNIDSLLSKAQLASSPAQLASVSNEIFMQSSAAKACFGQLPQENISLEHTARFLSQVGDYTYVLSQNMINGTAITPEEYDSLNRLNEYASDLGRRLNETEQRIYSGEFKFINAGSSSSVHAAGPDIIADLEEAEKSFEGYPSLIYDGPFSEHIENMEPYMTKDAPEITEDEALKAAQVFLGDRGAELRFDYETGNTKIETYNFTDGDRSISITKKGGYVLDFIENREVDDRNYDINAAAESAMAFLSEHGFKDMSQSYYEAKDNIATINFAYSQDGVKCYSDLIKVRVALDDGEIIGIECRGYLMNHRVRDIAPASLSESEAKACVSTHLDVTGVSLSVIPKDSLREVLCYEFKGNYMGKNFIVYINADTGKEEDILLLIESPEGVLTI